LVDAGVIKRDQEGYYSLTSLGRVVHKTTSTIKKALDYYWKMKAIESILSSSPSELSRSDLTNLIESLIDNHEIRDIITTSSLSSYDDFEIIGKMIDRNEIQNQ
jgi:hypothetical protein